MGPDAAAPSGIDEEPPLKKAKTGKGRFGRSKEEDEQPRVAFPSSDKAPQLSLSGDRLTVTGTTGGGGGYRMARASHGVSAGCWYWECAVASDRPAGCHYRVGWATKKAPLQAPVGYDRWSFAYRDVAGALVHASNRVDGYGSEWGPGDVVGCLIVFGDGAAEDLDDEKPPDESARPDGGDVSATNYVRFFVNGVDQGVAYAKLPPGTYFPAVSVYKAGQVTANFGPSFAHAVADLDVKDAVPSPRLCVERSAAPLSDLIPPPPPPPEDGDEGPAAAGEPVAV